MTDTPASRRRGGRVHGAQPPGPLAVWAPQTSSPCARRWRAVVRHLRGGPVATRTAGRGDAARPARPTSAPAQAMALGPTECLARRRDALCRWVAGAHARWTCPPGAPAWGIPTRARGRRRGSRPAVPPREGASPTGGVHGFWRLALGLLLLLLAGSPAVGDCSDHRLAASPPASAFDHTVAKAWMDLAYTLVKTQPGTPPPVAARVYGYLGVTLYEAVVPGAVEPRSLAGQLHGLAVEALPAPADAVHHWPAVANSAAALVLWHFFPGATPQIMGLLQRFEAEFAAQATPAVLARSSQYGQDVARAILTWAATDGFSALAACQASFVLPAGPGAWTGSGTGLQPCWGTLRPFVLPPGKACAAAGPPAYATSPRSAFFAHALLVYNTTGHAGAHLTPEQKAIAHFWADSPTVTGTPPGHWVAITGIVAAQAALSLAHTVEAYARVGIAVADAFISCWRTKYDTALLRPVTYIHTHITAAWQPLIPTPNFPTYPSGHATQSGAAATVLTALFGPRAFTDTTHRDLNPELGYPDRAFADFYAAAHEAAASRLYGGIHYLFDNTDGLAQGLCIGTHINTTLAFTRPRRSDTRHPATAERPEAGQGSHVR